MPVTYTATGSGLWSEGSTWQSASGQFPSASGDIVTINAGQTVTYDITSSVEFGAVNVNGLLTWTGSKNTLMTFGNSTLTIGAAGELRIGTSSAVLTGSVSASIMFNRTSDGTGIGITAGGKLTIYGDPAYYGNNYATYIAEPFTSSNISSSTVVVAGDFTSSWQAGQELIIHKGTTYSVQTTDIATGSIVSLTASGSNTAISMSGVTAGNYFVGGRVLNVSRNVILSKLNAGKGTHFNNTNRWRIVDNNTTAGNVNIYDATFIGCDRGLNGGISTQVNNVIIRNGNQALYGTNNVTFNGVVFACAYHAYTINGGQLGGFFCGGSDNGSLASIYATFDGEYFGNSYVINRMNKCVFNGYCYSNQYAVNQSIDTILSPSASLSYNSFGSASNNTHDFNMTIGYGLDVRIRGSKTRTPPVFNNRNTDVGDECVVYCEDYGQVVSSSRAFWQFGDVIRNDNVLRSGGATSTLEVVPQSLCNTRHGVPFIEWAEANVSTGSHTRGFYASGSGWSTTLSASEFYFEAEYYSSPTTPAKTTVQSTQQLTNDTPNWQKISVTFSPAQVGPARYKGWLKAYQLNAEVYVDNQLQMN